MTQPSARTAIQILSTLQDQTNPATLAFWVTPNTILTLSGARAYCDGVFYHNDKGVLEEWVQEMKEAIKILASITDVYFAEARLDKTTSKEDYAGYDLVLTQGLEYMFGQTELVGPEARNLISQRLHGKELVESLTELLKNSKTVGNLDDESRKHAATGILLGYPDKAIIGSVTAWDEDDSFAEPLIDADIRGSRYYICPQPVYQYPRRLVTDTQINEHEQLWSRILKDFYMSDFHKTLAGNKAFQQKAKDLELLG